MIQIYLQIAFRSSMGYRYRLRGFEWVLVTLPIVLIRLNHSKYLLTIWWDLWFSQFMKWLHRFISIELRNQWAGTYVEKEIHNIFCIDKAKACMICFLLIVFHSIDQRSWIWCHFDSHLYTCSLNIYAYNHRIFDNIQLKFWLHNFCRLS